MEVFLLISTDEMHSQHLVGFFWFCSDKEMERGMLELCAQCCDRCQQRHPQREVVIATSLRCWLSARSLIVSC